MCKLFSMYEKEIKKYCEDNFLDFDTVCKCPKCSGKNDVWVQYHDEEKGKRGLKDETPAPIILKINVVGGKVAIEQTEYTDRYLKKVS